MPASAEKTESANTLSKSGPDAHSPCKVLRPGKSVKKQRKRTISVACEVVRHSWKNWKLVVCIGIRTQGANKLKHID